MQCIWNFIWSEKRFFESIDVSGKCVDISKREKILLILRQDLSARNVLLALPVLLCVYARNSGCGKTVSNYELFCRKISVCATRDLNWPKSWGMCSMTWFSQVSMSQWGLPKDVTVIGIWWLGHFLSSQPPLPPFPLHHPSPSPQIHLTRAAN